MEQERRQFKRLPTALIARLRTRKATATETLQLQIGNVSTGGVFITTPYPFPVGTIVEFDFTLPHSETLIHIKGAVRWTRMRGDETGMGVEFLEASTDSRVALQEYVQRRLMAGDLPLPPTPPR